MTAAGTEVPVRNPRVVRHAAVAVAVSAALTLSACAPRPPGRRPPLALWLYCGAQLDRPGEPERLATLWSRAAAAGYTRVMLTDPRFDRLGEMDAGYFASAARVKRLADSLGVELVPALFTVGRSNTLLALDPDLAEALPVRDARLEVRGGVARVVADPAVALGARPDFADPWVSVSDGRARIGAHLVRSRFAFHVPVAPFRCYHLSVEVRTRGYTGKPMVTVLGGARALTYTRSLGLAPTQDWTRVDLVFGSLDQERVTVWLGDWKAALGTVEWRAWRLEECGPVNVVRRAGAPFVIAGRTEGRDYEPVRDSLLGRVPWRGQYQAWHAPPEIRTPLPDGTRLRASWYFAPVLYGKQVTICPSEPATLDLMRDQAARMKALWGAGGYMMMHDEIRVLDWDESCARRGATSGAVLAADVRECVGLLAGSRVYVWSDMFDPYQNAVRGYHLVRGDLAGSWEGLDSSVTIVNWNAGRATESLRFFARRGHRQVIAAYYDGAPSQVRGWIAAARGVAGVEGVMYTTWQGRYDDLEAFAREARAEWAR